MIQLILQIFLGLLFNFFNGLQDIGNSKTEIGFARMIRTLKVSGKLKILYESERANNSRLWHRWGGFTYFIAGPLWGFSFFKDDVISGIYLSFLFWLMRPLVFNPTVAKGLPNSQGFFHLSKNGWDGWWRSKVGEKGYYFGSLILFLCALVLIYLRNFNHG